MSDKLPQRIDPIRAAEQGLVLRGRVPVRQLPRLFEVVVAEGDPIEVEFRFERDIDRRPFVALDCRAELLLRCERCLGEVRFELDQRQRLELIDGSVGTVEPGPESLVVGEDGLYLRDLLEDEVLLALPLIPRHGSREACDQENLVWLAGPEVDEKPKPEQAANPFDVLRTLKD